MQDTSNICGELIAQFEMNPDNSEALMGILSCFYRGFPILALGKLLTSQDIRVLTGALFIAEELGKTAFSMLNHILVHAHSDSPDVRFAAYNAISSCVSAQPDGGFAYVALGMQDSDKRCRKTAVLWMMRIPAACLTAALERLRALSSERATLNALRMILSPSARDPLRIREWLADPIALTKKVGLIAGARLPSLNLELLSLGAQNADPDIKECAEAQLHFLSIISKKSR